MQKLLDFYFLVIIYVETVLLFYDRRTHVRNWVCSDVIMEAGKLYVKPWRATMSVSCLWIQMEKL